MMVIFHGKWQRPTGDFAECIYLNVINHHLHICSTLRVATPESQ